VVKTSILLICLGVLLSLTTTRWWQSMYRRTLPQIYLEAKAGRLKSATYQKIVALMSIIFIGAGTYLALTWR
jgi:hypothetical protein